VRIERLAVVRRDTVDWAYMDAPSRHQLYLDRIDLT
jgi:hypothetical protein